MDNNDGGIPINSLCLPNLQMPHKVIYVAAWSDIRKYFPKVLNRLQAISLFQLFENWFKTLPKIRIGIHII